MLEEGCLLVLALALLMCRGSVGVGSGGGKRDEIEFKWGGEGCVCVEGGLDDV